MASLNDFQEQLDILSATKTSIKEAIIGKGQEVSSEDSFSSYADKIDDIVTLEEGTADADARAKDIALNKTAYVSGNKVTGTLRDLRASGSSIAESELDIPYKQGTSGDSVLFHLSLHKDLGYGVPDVDTIINENTRIQYTLAGSEIANLVGLTGADIRKGATRFGVAGTFTDDADATAQDIAYNKTAYVNGTKVTGSIETIGPNEEISGMLMDATTVQKTTIYDEHDNPYPGIQYTFLASGNTLTRDGADVSTNAKYSDIVSALSGTADGISADKILSGKTILGVSGTATSDATATADNIVADKTAYVNGNKVVGNMHYAGGTVSGQTYHSFRGTSFDLNLSGFPKSLIFNTDALTLNGYIPAGRYVQVWADINALNSYIGLTANKLKVGESVLGVQGTFTSDANATADDICVTKSAYVNGQKISGNIPIHPADTESGFSPSNVEYLPNGSGFLKYTAKCTDAVNLHGNYQVGAYISISSQASTVRNAVGLTADKLKAGESVLGITGTFTDDATATSDDISRNKTAYVNGTKITGTRDRVSSSSIGLPSYFTFRSSSIDNQNQCVGITNASNNSCYVNSGDEVKTFIPFSNLATAIGLTANKIKSSETILGIQGSVVELNGDTETVTPTTSQQIITPTSPKNALTQVTVNAVTSAIDQNIVASNIKDGVTILGVTGTYITPMKEYVSETAMNNDIANIQEGEVVKVVASGVTTYYVKESGIGYQSLDLSSLSVGDTISLKGMKINKTAISHVLQGAGDMATIQFTDNNVNVLKIYFSAGRTAVSGYVTIDEDTYNYANTTEGNPSSLSDADVETINSSNIWNSDTLLTVAINDTTLNDEYIEDAILEPITVYSMKKLVKEEDTISPSDYEEAEEQIGDLFGEEESE